MCVYGWGGGGGGGKVKNVRKTYKGEKCLLDTYESVQGGNQKQKLSQTLSECSFRMTPYGDTRFNDKKIKIIKYILETERYSTSPKSMYKF